MNPTSEHGLLLAPVLLQSNLTTTDYCLTPIQQFFSYIMERTG
jgi:hypothetical protein